LEDVEKITLVLEKKDAFLGNLRSQKFTVTQTG